jgi:hypothetical protein
LTAAFDKNVRTLCDEPLYHGEAYAARFGQVGFCYDVKISSNPSRGESSGSQDDRTYDGASIVRVLDNVELAVESEEQMFSYYILSICSHAYAMRQRDVLNDAE